LKRTLSNQHLELKKMMSALTPKAANTRTPSQSLDLVAQHDAQRQADAARICIPKG
jgi:hypothetical protein